MFVCESHGLIEEGNGFGGNVVFECNVRSDVNVSVRVQKRFVSLKKQNVVHNERMSLEFVLFQIFRQLERGIAKGALVWLEFGVSGLVSVSGALLHESNSANPARMSDVSQMSAHVSLERPFVCESLSTSVNVTKEQCLFHGSDGSGGVFHGVFPGV